MIIPISQPTADNYATVIISTRTVKLQFKRNLASIAKNILANPKKKLQLVKETGGSTKLLCSKPLTPPLPIRGINKPIFLDPINKKSL